MEPLDLEPLKARLILEGELPDTVIAALIAEVERLRGMDLQSGRFAYQRGYREGHAEGLRDPGFYPASYRA